MEQISLFGEKKKSTDWKWTMAEDYPQEKNGLKVFSCFSCGGGSTMGYKLAGCEVIGNCEIDVKMNDVYIKNHHPKYNYCMDIRDFNKLDNLPDELYNLDILDGSPPCTTFSMAGNREDSWGKKKKFREGQAEQTLDDLSFVFIETAKKLKPKMVIMENVEGLLLGNAWAYVQRIYKEFDDAGYKVNHYLLKGENMGIPQKRHRVFFIAVRKDIEFDYEKLDMHFDYEPVTYGEVKEGIGYANKETQWYKVIQHAEPSDIVMADTLQRIGKERSKFNAVYCWENSICGTLVAKYEHYDPKDKTKISKESIRNIATFPRDYDFGTGSASGVCYICGMSVPPVMIKRIVNKIINNL